MDDTIPAILKHWAETLPEKEAFVFYNENGRDSVLTAKDVYQLSGRFATKLKNLGFQYGNVISNALPNSPERIITDFGIIMAGCVPTNCQIISKDGSEFWGIVRHYQSVGLVLPYQEGDHAYTLFKQFLPSELPPSRVVDASIPQAPTINHVICIERYSSSSSSNNCNIDNDFSVSPSFLDSLRQSSDEIFSHPDITAKTLGYIFATSGSTGLGKPSPRTQEAMLTTGRAYERGGPTVRLCQRPIGWVGGFPYSFLANCTCVVIQDHFEGKSDIGAQQFWDIIESERCTSGFLLPEEMQPLIDHFKDNPPKHKLDMAVTGGRPITKEKICEALGLFTKAVLVSYASTEMNGVTGAFITKPEDMEDFLVGHPMPGVSLRIVNDKMQDLEAGEPGVILVKSPYGTNTYYNYTPPKPTTTEDGYFITGDRGWLDQRGRLFVSDRNDYGIHHGSVVVFPSWPESILRKIPEVSEAVVFGISIGDGIEHNLCACIVLKPGSDMTKEQLKLIYNSKFTETKDEFFPDLARIELFSNFPKTHTGKVNARKLREMVLEMS